MQKLGVVLLLWVQKFSLNMGLLLLRVEVEILRLFGTTAIDSAWLVEADRYPSVAPSVALAIDLIAVFLLVLVLVEGLRLRCGGG